MTLTLNNEQQYVLSQWVNEGLSLSDIQKRMAEEWQLSVRYMDLRFLVDDLNLVLASKPEPVTPVVQPAPKAPVAGSEVVVSVDAVVKPGAIASGKVTFKDGVTCTWQVDRMGRLALVPGREGYEPSMPEIQEFQRALQMKLQGAGF